ncbi:superoxide dismutase family protein [Halobacillus litoralis]|uniref:superoxide dismutase family protein n=1 Tax=Halobacillus litoralis TaxID=45668 RepID=UPI0032B50A1D
MKLKRWSIVFFLVLTAIVFSACGTNTEEDSSPSENGEENTTNEENQEKSETPENIMVTLNDRDGNEVGSAELEQKNGGVNIKLSASALPEGTHGFHIHEKGVCEAPDYKSAGGHFNPTDVSHGSDSEDGPHAGDLNNIDIHEEGNAEEEVMADMVTLKEGQDNSLLGGDGTSLVIHAGADDQKSQPSGDAGERIACGVIEN